MLINNNNNNFNLKLNGIVGTSRTNDSSEHSIKVFSTFANSNSQNGLLSLLKPMREIVEAAQLSDLSSLLQRDLNDKRVADHLVPYLLGQANNSFAFFPSIIAVLIPTDFLSAASEELQYPPLIESEVSLEDNYNNYWKITYYPQDNEGTKSNIGELSINTSKVTLVVIDGQHRANAFRVVTKNFNTNQFIYGEFYSNLLLPDIYNSDLPVTIIWFESKTEATQKIDPKFISRRLFIDVNNNAKSISNSRSILLDDFDPIAVSTRGFYSYLAAKNGFKGDVLSLLQTGFDIDSNLKDLKQNDICFTNPEIVYDIFYRIFFNNRNFWAWDQKDIKSQRFSYDKDPATRYLGDKIVKNIKVYSELEEDYSRYSSKLIVTDEQIIEEIPKRLTDQYEQIEYLINTFIFYKNHMISCQAVEKEISTIKYSVTVKDVWKKIFSGGEGLFYSLEQIKTSKSPLTNIDKIQKEIIEIFTNHRHRLFPTITDYSVINKFYNQTLTAKAFQVGFITAYYHLNEKFFVQAADFISIINEFIEKNTLGFIYLMTEVRKGIVGELDPKKWPTVQNLFIRIYCEQSNKTAASISNYFQDSPDVVLFSNSFNEIVNSLFVTLGVTNNSVNYDKIDSTQYYEKLENTIDKCQNMIEQTGLQLLPDYRELCIMSLDNNELFQFIRVHTSSN